MTIKEWTDWKAEYEKKIKIDKWILLFQQVDQNKIAWKKTYDSYLQSDVWKEIRNQAIPRAKGKCEKCGAVISDPDVHHKSYMHIGGKEKPEDLQVLCYPCHRKADVIREINTDERRKNNLYLARLYGFAKKKFGYDWQDYYEESEIEIKFILFLYKLYCSENELNFDGNLDPEIDYDFLDFWDEVLEGNQ